MLNNEMQSQGRWLFRWRSYLPILFFVLFIPAFQAFHYPFGSRVADLCWEGVCLLIGLTGLFVRCLVIGYVPAKTSGRNTKGQIAETLNTTGMYSLIRNPLYLGNFLMWSAPVLFLHDWQLYLIYILVFALYYERIIATEESFLAEKFGAEYRDWSSKTPLLFPRHLRWQKPELPFSWKTMIRREYHGFFGLIAVLAAMEHISEIVINKKVGVDPPWAVIFITSAVIYIVIRLIAKYTNRLNVEGR